MIAAMLLQPTPPIPPEMSPFVVAQIVHVAISFFVMIGAIVLGAPIIRSLSRRFIERPSPPAALPADLTARLERIEQAVDAIAIEVERISEAQRYSTKLMSESRGGARALPGTGPENR